MDGVVRATTTAVPIKVANQPPENAMVAPKCIGTFASICSGFQAAKGAVCLVGLGGVRVEQSRFDSWMTLAGSGSLQHTFR